MQDDEDEDDSVLHLSSCGLFTAFLDLTALGFIYSFSTVLYCTVQLYVAKKKSKRLAMKISRGFICCRCTEQRSSSTSFNLS